MFKKNSNPLYIDIDPLGISLQKANNHNNNKQSPFPSPSSSSSTSSLIHERTKCQLVRPTNQCTSSPISKITPKSWESVKSPAASFLAGFSFSPVQTVIQDEQTGDEIDDYVLDKIIGYGGFSTVREGYRISDGQKVAIKIIRKNGDMDAVFDRELTIWKSLHHQHIVQLQKILETDNALFIICDYCDGGNLLSHVNKNKKLTENEAKRIFKELCQAVYYLHEDKKICHKDLKLENVLLSDDQVKLGDFGLAMYQQPPKMNPATQLPLSPQLDDNQQQPAGGSLAYAAPEQIRSPLAIPCPSTDIWSLGIILYTLVTGQLPFRDDFDLRLQQKILNGQYTMPQDISQELKDLIQHCLELDTTKRFNIHQVLQSTWCSSQ